MLRMLSSDRRCDGFGAAQERMTSLKAQRFVPDAAAHAVYAELYALYRELHDVFGAVKDARADLGTLMKRLLAIRERTAARSTGEDA